MKGSQPPTALPAIAFLFPPPLQSLVGKVNSLRLLPYPWSAGSSAGAEGWRMARGGEFSSVNFFLRLGTRLSWVLPLLMREGEEKERLSPWPGPSPTLTSCLPQLPPPSPAAAPLSLFVPSLLHSSLQNKQTDWQSF